MKKLTISALLVLFVGVNVLTFVWPTQAADSQPSNVGNEPQTIPFRRPFSKVTFVNGTADRIYYSVSSYNATIDAFSGTGWYGLEPGASAYWEGVEIHFWANDNLGGYWWEENNGQWIDRGGPFNLPGNLSVKRGKKKRLTFMAFQNMSKVKDNKYIFNYDNALSVPYLSNYKDKDFFGQEWE